MIFALILLILLLISGILWLVEHCYARKRRAKDAKKPWWVEYGASFFPVILIVFVLRSFVVEPFKIPSGSMIPTLLVGDFILVNKWTYGIRLPIINKKVMDINMPQRGDVMVFRYPPDPGMDYVKRVIGLPGDKIEYENKRLKINGEELPVTSMNDYLHDDKLYYSLQYEEKLGNVTHRILNNQSASAFIQNVLRFPQRDLCVYTSTGVRCTVPPGHYFMMGDNRDDSADSRMWGFVPEENIIGRAFFIWFNFSDLKRIGRIQ